MLGQTLYYTLPEGPSTGERRPAQVVRVNPDGTVDLSVRLSPRDGLGSPILMRRDIDPDILSDNPDAPFPEATETPAPGPEASAADQGETDADDGD